MKISVRNQTDQPVELHLPERVVVLGVSGAAELSAEEALSPQVSHLAAGLRISLHEIEETPPDLEAAKTTPAGRRKPRAAGRRGHK